MRLYIAAHSHYHIMTLFKNKYRIESTRLRGWDYGAAGYYYLTICTNNRTHFFGHIINNDIQLSPIGKIVAEEWQKTETIRDNVVLDQWVIMPNHMHVILVLTHKIEPHTTGVEPHRGCGSESDKPKKPMPKRPANTIGSIMAQFKSVCTKRIRKAGFTDFEWQRGFYDRIIRTEESLHKARHYIMTNPERWAKDRDNVAGLYM